MTEVTPHPDLTEPLDVLLIDADILCYEFPFGAEYKGDEGQLRVRDFDSVAENIERWLQYLQQRLQCNVYEMYLTGQGNFREQLAVTKKYKDLRLRKPFHYKTTREWLRWKYNATEVHGMEADDILAVKQTRFMEAGQTPCIVSRDKDLMMVQGWHYQWSVHNQPEKLSKATKLGHLTLGTGKKRKLRGDGLRWFYAQCILGDPTDTIPGLPGCGDVMAYNTLKDCETEQEMFSAVRTLYHTRGFDDAYLIEQARLLWMCTELNDEGNPVMWKPPIESELSDQ